MAGSTQPAPPAPAAIRRLDFPVKRSVCLYHLNPWEKLKILDTSAASQLQSINVKIVGGSRERVEAVHPALVVALAHLEANSNSPAKRKKFAAHLRAEPFREVPVKPINVFRLVRQFFRTFVPDDLIGRFEVVAQAVKAMIGASHRANLFLGDLLPPAFGTGLPWLSSRSVLIEELEAKFGLWILENLVWRLVRSLFHPTDTSFGRAGLFYYRKRAWQGITDSQIAHMTHRTKVLRVLNSRKKVELVQSQRNAPRPKLARLFPKKSGFRLICHGPKSVTAEANLEVQYRRLLHYLKSKTYPESIDVRGKALHGLLKTYFGHPITQASGEIYFAKVDIENAFESILLPRMKQILSILGSQTDDVLYYHKIRYSFRGSPTKFSKSFVSASEFPDLPSYIPPNGQFSGQDRPVEIRTQEMIRSIYQRISLHVIRFNVGKATKHFLKVKGLVQGDTLSTILCDIYFGQMVKSEMDPIFQFSDPRHQSGRLFVRGMDDFLFVSVSRSDIVNFLKRMRAGFPDYGCQIQDLKTQTNVDDIQVFETIFCGSRVNFKERNVRPDFSTLDNQKIVHSLKINLASMLRKESFIQRKALFLATLKLEPIYLDGTYNSSQVIVENLSRTFNILGLRVLALLCILYPQPNQRPSPTFLPGLFKACRGRILARMCSIRSRAQLDITKSDIDHLFASAMFGLFKGRSQFITREQRCQMKRHLSRLSRNASPMCRDVLSQCPMIGGQHIHPFHLLK
eukprot:maker-scaffold60_size442463-snap-gene-3.25 protein:Tk12078 transcript:maker-scaffold60_size442463-snap-gene-3.25-mRNA-1 annotation:"telomerase reverse transcriptase"